jgi:CRISPR-associated endoribonuclease Cas6
MLSPLVIYSTLTHPNGLKHTYYYKPDHEKFSEMVAANMKRKYLSLYPKQSDILDSPFLISPRRYRPQDKVVTKYKGTIIEGWMGDYELRGDPRLIELAYHSGLGSKGQQGFGLFEILEIEGSEPNDSRDPTARERTA